MAGYNAVTFRPTQRNSALPKFIVIIAVLAIIAALGSGLYFMMKDNDESDRLVKALTWRVALSVGLFVFLMAGHYFGWFMPNERLPY